MHRVIKTKPINRRKITILGHSPNELSVRHWSGRLGFNPMSSHTKDSKNGT